MSYSQCMISVLMSSLKDVDTVNIFASKTFDKMQISQLSMCLFMIINSLFLRQLLYDIRYFVITY